ncbi:histidine kinase [Spirosoma aureum]|uniref:Histidine kinase n=1 Tax=Spirosoma aureum TaxID=2692134 RepID=A0A6G9AJ25_9BACT|nr:histidine kinase [Spirosoma aureum]QIP12448.1 histidine kinase [Spirosoma aureum]
MNKPVRFSPLGPFCSHSRWTYVLAVPCFAILFGHLLVGDNYWHNGWVFAEATVLNGFLLSGTFFTQNQVSKRITERYPRFEQTTRRILTALLAQTTLSAFFLTITATIYSQLRLAGSLFTYEAQTQAYVVTLIFTVLAVGMDETVYALNQWQQNQVNKEKLKEENLKGQLQGLKNQVNPHFLFNSLNSLSSLIADEPQRAEQFVDQMARVYRYMLQTNRSSELLLATNQANNDELTTLDAELAFIDSYYHLLKTRHGDGLYLHVRVSNQYRQHRLPPLTLQLLVENAVKHNVILASRPLSISIEITKQGHLCVRNNLQKKATRPGCTKIDELESTQAGLANIRAKYQLLAQSELNIETGPDFFTVTIPLLAKASTTT